MDSREQSGLMAAVEVARSLYEHSVALKAVCVNIKDDVVSSISAVDSISPRVDTDTSAPFDAADIAFLRRMPRTGDQVRQELSDFTDSSR